MITTANEIISVIINGANGRMGKEVVNAVSKDSQLKLVAQTDQQDNLAEHIKKTHANIVIDFTAPTAVFENAKTIINNNARPVIGTTGLTAQQISTLQQICAEKKLGGIIAPNFSIGAVLMMKLASVAAKYFNHVEIIEMHHEGKKDAPSGTAIKTAEMLTKQLKEKIPANASQESLPGVRGGDFQNIRIHSVRLPGLVAHQQILFGGLGEILTIKHDTTHRECFMPGVLLACKKVMNLDHLVYGLENILE